MGSKGEYGKAIADFDEAIPIRTRVSPRLLFSCTSLLRSFQRGSSGEDFKAALQFNPHNANAHLGLGKIYRARHDIDQSVDAFSRAIDISAKLGGGIRRKRDIQPVAREA